MSIIVFLIACLVVLLIVLIVGVIYVAPFVLISVFLEEVFYRIFEKNQVKYVTKGYRIPFSLYIERDWNWLNEEAEIKLVELARTSKKHKRMFVEYVKEKTSWDDYFGRCRICWRNKAYSLLNSPLYRDLRDEYERILNRINEKEKKKASKKKNKH